MKWILEFAFNGNTQPVMFIVHNILYSVW